MKLHAWWVFEYVPYCSYGPKGVVRSTYLMNRKYAPTVISALQNSLAAKLKCRILIWFFSNLRANRTWPIQQVPANNYVVKPQHNRAKYGSLLRVWIIHSKAVFRLVLFCSGSYIYWTIRLGGLQCRSSMIPWKRWWWWLLRWNEIFHLIGLSASIPFHPRSESDTLLCGSGSFSRATALSAPMIHSLSTNALSASVSGRPAPASVARFEWARERVWRIN